jgi:hypothetical protein
MIETVEVNLSRYLQGPGTGTTNLPSFSAIKFSVVLVELPLSSFFSITITSFFVDLRLSQTFPPLRESCGAVAFFHVVWRQIHQVDLGNFVARSTRLHHLVKTNNHRVCARRIKDRLQCRAVIGSRAVLYLSTNAFSCSALAARAQRPEMITSGVIKSSDFMEESENVR